MRRSGRALLHASSLLLALALAAIAAIACVLHFPPAELLRRAALPIARQQLGLPSLDLGSLDFSVGRRGHLEIRNLYLGPPAGYTLPLLTADRIALRYDLRELGSQRIRLGQLEVQRPVLRVERRHDKPNWVALLEALAGPEPEQEPAEEPPAEPSTPSPVTLDVGLVAISGLAAFVDDGRGQIAVEGLDLRMNGSHSPDGSRGVLTVRMEKRAAQQANVGLRMLEPQPVYALLDTRILLDARLDSLEPLAANAKLELDVRSEKLEANVPTRPTRLSLRLTATSDGKKDHTRLEELSLQLNGHDIVQASGDVTTQANDPHIALSVAHLTLPLDLLCPYAALVVPQLSCGGTVRLADVQIAAAANQLGQAPPDSLSGRLEIDDVWAHLAGPAADAIDVKQLNGRFYFATAAGAQGVLTSSELLARLPRGQATAQRPTTGIPATVRGQLRIGALEAAGARLENATLRTTAGLTTQGLEPKATAARLQVDLPRVRFTNASLGTVRSSLRADLAAHANLGTSTATLERLRVSVGDAVNVQIRAAAQGYGQRALRATVVVPPFSLAKLIAALPPRLRSELPLKKASGQMELKVDLRGRLPSAGTSPLAMPLRIELLSRFHKVRLQQLSGARSNPASQVVADVKGASGQIRVSGKPRDLEVSVSTKVASLSLPEGGLSLKQLDLPITLRWKRNAIEGTVRAHMSQADQRRPGERITLRQPHLSGKFAARVPVQRLVAGRQALVRQLSVLIRAAAKDVRVQQPGTQIRARVEQVGFELRADGRPSQPLNWTVSAILADLQDKTNQLTVQRVGLTAGGDLKGLALTVPTPVLSLDDLSANLRGALRVSQVSSAIASKAAKRLGTQLDVEATLEPGGPLRLSRLSVSVPGFGARLDVSATLPHPFATLASTALPEFSVRLAADVDSTPFAKSGSQLTLPLGLVGVPYDVAIARGKLGIRLEADHAGKGDISLAGRVLAKGVNLRADQQPQAIEGPQGALTRQNQLKLRISNLEADIPIRQKARVRFEPTSISLPAPARSILARRGNDASYRFVRPFVARRTTLSVDRIQLVRELSDTSSATTKLISRNELTIGRTVLDLALEDATAKINQVYVKLFGGDVSGRIQLQVPQLDPLDLRLSSDIQLTNVDFAHLDPAARKRGEHTYISGLARLNYELAAERASGTVLLTDISLDALDALLASLDPHGIDKSIQANRQIINAWYTRAASPKVSKIPIWVNYSHLNLDIELDAPWPVGAILRSALSKVRPRRVSIKPILHKVAQSVRGTAHLPRRPKVRSARRGELR